LRLTVNIDICQLLENHGCWRRTVGNMMSWMLKKEREKGNELCVPVF